MKYTDFKVMTFGTTNELVGPGIINSDPEQAEYGMSSHAEGQDQYVWAYRMAQRCVITVGEVRTPTMTHASTVLPTNL